MPCGGFAIFTVSEPLKSLHRLEESLSLVPASQKVTCGLKQSGGVSSVEGGGGWQREAAAGSSSQLEDVIGRRRMSSDEVTGQVLSVIENQGGRLLRGTQGRGRATRRTF